MADTKVPVRTETSSAQRAQQWHPFERFRREMDRLFDDFAGGFWGGPLFAPSALRRAESTFVGMPAVDVAETDKAYEITAELPGMEEKNIEVKLANGVLSIKGEKQEEKEEKDKNYYRRERNFGSFERSFQVPDDVEADKIEASFKNGVLSVTLPKKAEAQKEAKNDRGEGGLVRAAPRSAIRLQINQWRRLKSPTSAGPSSSAAPLPVYLLARSYVELVGKSISMNVHQSSSSAVASAFSLLI